MSPTAQSEQSCDRTFAQDLESTGAEPTNKTKRSKLLAELTKQRNLLLASAHSSLLIDAEPQMHPDPLDQASTEFEQDLALQVRIRTFEKLRRVERALRLMRTNDYGRCRRCREEIPYERLKIQPTALFCVPCLILVEQEAAKD